MARKAIALDIDGVVLKGGKVIPGAKEAISRLVQEKVPFIFITNGGGIIESEKAELLTHKLDIPIEVEQVLQCHTPYQSLVSKYGNSPILVLGKPSCLEVARSYGFQKIYDSQFIFENSPGILPTRKHHNPHAPRNPLPPIEAAFIFDDPVDWTLDMQVLSDLLIGEEKTTVPSPTDPNNLEHHHKKFQKIPLFACNADIVYATDYPHPRYTQGAFVESFRHLFQLYHRIPLQMTYYGKPFDIQYRYAEDMLHKQSEKLGYDHPPLQFFGVGDNPKSDIQGANAAGDHWHSILVKTGLFPSHGKENDHEHPANHVCDSIVEAIDYILKL